VIPAPSTGRSRAADEALGKLPMPAFAGIQLGAPSIKGAAGFLIADIAVN
jgi:hypothetical protein